MSYPLIEIDGIDEEVVRIFRKAGIRTTTKLLEAAKDLKGVTSLAAKTGFSKSSAPFRGLVSSFELGLVRG